MQLIDVTILSNHFFVYIAVCIVLVLILCLHFHFYRRRSGIIMYRPPFLVSARFSGGTEDLHGFAGDLWMVSISNNYPK